ncbi:MAG: transglutaminase domain-containing protein [Candidatus Heimdallarchaeota archaeon]|nr:MAG: transglutaminase domain-containing protein [Candidatus Heimdallarchaeota archaeon]
MSTEQLGKDPAPSAIRYLVLASAFTCFITAISFVQAQFGTSTQEELFYQQAIGGFTLISVFTMVEWFLLGRSRKMVGPYGFALVFEIFKTILLNFATIEFMETISGASSPFFLHQMISLAIIFMLALTKVARTRIDQLAQKDISRNLLNLLPTLLIIALFMGTYITEIVGLGTPRQSTRFEDYKDKNINWELYNTPTWDATYLLENLLDQFTAGLLNPYAALFNVSSDQSDETYPPAYWRIGSLETYERHGTTSGTDVIGWWRYDPLGYRSLSPYETGTPYSQEIAESERTARFTVQVPLDYSTELVDVSVHNSFPNCLPTTWNGESGSFVDANSFRLYDASDNPLTLDSFESQEIYPGDYSPSFNDLLGIYADVTIDDDTSSEEGIFEYTMDYQNFSKIITDAALFSKTKDDYEDILSPTDWANIQDIYLQYPNTPSELPTSGYVHTGGGVPIQDYEDWAPFVVGNASECTSENQTVFSQALAEMQRLSPEYYINTDPRVTAAIGLPSSPTPISVVNSTGRLGLGFDFDMWLGNQDPLNQGIPMAHPEDNEDYNEWFLFNGNGVSLHFASLFVTLMRIRGIPSRIVVGYLGGEASDDGSKRVITNMMLHAWAEVLIPIEEVLTVPPFFDPRVQWVSFDPLVNFLSDVLPIGTPIDIPALSTVANTVLIDPNWPHQDFGPVQSSAVIGLAASDDLDRKLNFQQSLNVSVRLMMITDPINPIGVGTWTTWQPSCDYLDQEVSFYLDTSPTLTSANVSMGASSINASGIASVSFDYDVFEHGDTVWFFAVVIFDEGTAHELVKTARTLSHSV